MRTFTKDELQEILRRHQLWLHGEQDGVRADLSRSNLSYSNLSGSNLSGSDLSGSNLSYSNLSGSNLSGSDLSGSDLSGSDLSRSDLSYSMGCNSRIQSLQIDPYKIIVLDNEIAWGGCTKKTVKQWLKYTGKDLTENQRIYLETITKPFLRMCLARKSSEVMNGK